MAKVVKIRKYNKLNEASFTNPFDEEGGYSPSSERDFISGELNKTPKVNSISKVGLWNTNVKNKIAYKNDRIYANNYFCAGDIVEECPVKLMSEKDLYSETIRDCVFPIDTNKGIYALPLGYAICYRNSMESGLPGNIEYNFDEASNMMVFTAITSIKKGNELIIDATDDDFANVIKPGQFKYEQGVEPIYRTKNFKIV
jgi:hypothetical protein